MRKEVARGKRKGESSAGYLVGEAKRGETSPLFVYAWGTARSVACVSVSTYLRSEGCEAKGTNASG